MEAGFLMWIAKSLGINVLRMAIYSGLIVSVIGGAVALKYHYINVGRQEMRDEISADNRKRAEDVSAAEAKVYACRTLGGQWNTVVGVCD